MPSPSPNRAIDTFLHSTEEHTKRFYANTTAVGKNDPHEGFTYLTLRRGLAVDYFFRVATDWQIFQDDWSVKAIAHQPQQFLRSQRMSIEKALRDSEIPYSVSRFTSTEVTIPSLGETATASHVRGILDPRGRNIEFSTSGDWSSWAKKNLAEPHKGTLIRMLTDDGNSSIIDLTRQLRNYIAHRSTSTLSQIQEYATPRSNDGSIGLAGKSNDPLSIERKYNIRDLGTYLDRALERPHGTPAQFITTRLQQIAESLRWS